MEINYGINFNVLGEFSSDIDYNRDLTEEDEKILSSFGLAALMSCLWQDQADYYHMAFLMNKK
jgi:hypothetical protein